MAAEKSPKEIIAESFGGPHPLPGRIFADFVLAQLDASGYAIVPKEATPEMLAAGAKGSGEDSKGVAVGAWDAMLAAAPK